MLPRCCSTFQAEQAEEGDVRRLFSDFSIDKILDLKQPDNDDHDEAAVHHRQPTASVVMPQSHETPPFRGTLNSVSN